MVDASAVVSAAASMHALRLALQRELEEEVRGHEIDGAQTLELEVRAGVAVPVEVHDRIAADVLTAKLPGRR
jgi:hypothetical protein